MNPGMRMYMMTHGNEPDRMAADDGKHQERRIGQYENGYQLPYREPRPEFVETQSRYRGEDGQWKSGRRRNAYEGRPESRYRNGGGHREEPMRSGPYKRSWEFSVEPTNYQVTEPGREHLDPYDPKEPPQMRYNTNDDYDDPTGRVIGFRPPMNHYGSTHSQPNGMQRGMHGMEEAEFGREDAEEWVEGMMNEDDQRPHGGKWDVDFLKPLAEKVGLPTDGPEFWEFYAVINSLYSDFCKVFNEYNFKSPMGYAKLAKAWIRDKDAVDDKTRVYYECIVKPKKEEEA